MNRRAMDIIMDSSWTGTFTFFRGPSRDLQGVGEGDGAGGVSEKKGAHDEHRDP